MKARFLLASLVYIFLVTTGSKFCVIEVEKDKKDEPVVSQTVAPHPVSVAISGKVIFKDYDSGEFKVSALLTTSCASGLCPVQGTAPLAQTTLNKPSSFQLFFETQFKDVIILVEHTDAQNKSRIGYQVINAFAPPTELVEISLDKPYSPLN